MQTKISPDNVTRLIEEGLLTVTDILHAKNSDFVAPSDIKDGSWLAKRQTRIRARLCGTSLEASFDPSRVATAPNFLAKVIAEHTGDPAPAPRPTEEELVVQSLSDAITNAWPDLSHHTKLQIHTALQREKKD